MVKLEKENVKKGKKGERMKNLGNLNLLYLV
jgi:hypothetical protein